MAEDKRIYVGMHDGVCAVTSADGGKTWQQGPITPLAHAAARLTASPAAPRRAYLAAYEAGVYRTDDGGLTWDSLGSYPTGYAHSVLAILPRQTPCTWAANRQRFSARLTAGTRGRN